ncbi:MAG: 2-oxo acid dehydrogenase subunit E2 [Veillonellaceae bacterium]|nr:2-oxo acid dehydrogenase subunit E2 [Veillonellaceae bacterium]
MAREITMPKLGLTMTTGKVGRWLVSEGSPVKQGEALLEIMTDKITNVIESPNDGVLLKIIAREGAELPVGAVLGAMGGVGEEYRAALPVAAAGMVQEQPSEMPRPLPAASAGTPKSGEEKIRISPLARKLAEEHGLNWSRIDGSGPSGRIVKEDVEAAIAAAATKETVSPRPSPAEPESFGPPEFAAVPYAGLRRVIGDHMAQSWTVSPKVDYHVSVDATAMLKLRQAGRQNEDERLSLTDIVVKIVARALKLRPNMNVALMGEQIRQYPEPCIGVAVALENGLVVPVVRNADSKALTAISREIRQLAQKARTGQLSLEEMRGGTFTVTNVGTFHSVDWFTPILNQPEAGILGIGRIADTPVVRDGQIVIRPMLGVSLSFDHRIIDGTPAAEFLKVVIDLMEDPCLALL